jgi:hypothetical protein
MKATPTARARATRDVDRYVLALEAIGKRLTSWCSFGAAIIDARRQGRLHPRDVNVEVFEPERKLITIQPLRSPAELGALQLMNNRSEALGLGTRSLQLGSLVSGLCSQVTHQPMQGIDIGW